MHDQFRSEVHYRGGESVGVVDVVDHRVGSGSTEGRRFTRGTGQAGHLVTGADSNGSNRDPMTPVAPARKIRTPPTAAGAVFRPR